MDKEIDGLLDCLREVEEELERIFEARRAEFRYHLEKRRVVFEKEVAAQHRQLKVGLARFLRFSPISRIISAPLVYALILPLVMLDLCISLYQAICFPLWGIARVPRSDFIVVDRHHLPYLNGIQKLNCIYCGYANGLIAFTREIAGRTEQYWCPIKHASRVATPHHRYRGFVDYGDAAGYRDKIKAFREKLGKS